jgi:hypothetical protein
MTDRETETITSADIGELEEAPATTQFVVVGRVRSDGEVDLIHFDVRDEEKSRTIDALLARLQPISRDEWRDAVREKSREIRARAEAEIAEATAPEA